MVDDHQKSRLNVMVAVARLLSRADTVVRIWRRHNEGSERAVLTNDELSTLEALKIEIIEARSVVAPVAVSNEKVHWLVMGHAMCGAGKPDEWPVGDSFVSCTFGRRCDVTCAGCKSRLAVSDGMTSRNRPTSNRPTSRNETHVERATRVLEDTLPHTSSRDKALDNLYVSDPKATWDVRLAAISAALYILREPREDPPSGKPADLVTLVKEWQAASAHFTAVQFSADINVVASAAEWMSRASSAIRDWRPKSD